MDAGVGNLSLCLSLSYSVFSFQRSWPTTRACTFLIYVPGWPLLSSPFPSSPALHMSTVGGWGGGEGGCPMRSFYVRTVLIFILMVQYYSVTWYYILLLESKSFPLLPGVELSWVELRYDRARNRPACQPVPPHSRPSHEAKTKGAAIDDSFVASFVKSQQTYLPYFRPFFSHFLYLFYAFSFCCSQIFLFVIYYLLQNTENCAENWKMSKSENTTCHTCIRYE